MLNAVQQSSSSATSHMKKYKKLKYLGKGSYGAAILVELRANPSQRFVLKEIVIGHMKPGEIEATKREAEVLHQMNHSNITSYIESFVENSKLHIVMEHADGGDLSAAIAKRKAENTRFYEEEEAMRIFVQICFALRHIHKANILHRDLKSQNIFLTSNGMVKLGDFGIAKVLDASEEQARTQIGTPYYLSPEICESKPYGTKSDIWSLGVVLYEILALEMPFQATSLPALVHRIISSEPNYAKIESRYSSTLVDLLKSLLLKNPDLRPSVNQIVKSEFLKSHISRLLSFTLKSGTGGVAVSPSLSEQQMRAMDADEAERNIDVARGRVVNGNAPLSVMDAKQVARDQQVERMRNMRQDMINKQRALQQPSNNNNNNNNRPFSPRSAGNSRAVSPKPNRGLSPKRDRERERAPPSSNNNNNNNNPFARQQQQRDPYEAAPVNTYESVARKEYFANRAAAQAIKAKVEQYERGGGAGGAAAILTAGTNNNFAANNNSNNTNAGNARRMSENDFATADPESRIAMLKAQKEQEREREIAQKEMQMRQAIEANREERRRLDALAAAAAKDNAVPSRDLERAQSKKAIAFEVNLGDNNPSAHPPRRLSHGAGAAAAAGGGGDAESGSAGGARVRRGWGPPVDGMEIAQAKGIARSGAAASSASSAPSSRNRGMMISEDSKPTTPSSSSSAAENDALLGGDNMLILDDDNRQVLQRLESKRKSQLEMKNEAREVLRKLREKKLMQAKGQKPREVRTTVVSPVKRVGEAQDDKASGLSPMQARLMEVMNSVETAQESVQNAVRSGGAGARSNPPRADAKEDKDSGKYSRMAKNEEIKAVRELEERFPLLSVADEKETSGNAEDELQNSLEQWLEQQKRSVTVRNKKPIQQRGAAGGYPLETLNEEADLAETVHEAEDVNMYSTASQTLNLNRRNGANNAVSAAEDTNNEYMNDEFDDFEEFDDAAGGGNSNSAHASRYDVNRPLRGQVMGDDVEVVGMQCMLAKALMGDDIDDDDEEEVYTACRK